MFRTLADTPFPFCSKSFPLEGGRVGMGVALDLAVACKTPAHENPFRKQSTIKSHPHPNPSPLKGEGLKSVARPQ